VSSADRFGLAGRVALVVGASRGIGRACAIGLAQAGAVVALAGRDMDGLSETAATIGRAGARATVHPVDVTRVGSLGSFVGDVTDAHGRIDVLVHASGTNVHRAAADVSEADWDTVVDTNLKGAFFCAQAVGRSMVEAGGGRIVFIGSTFSIVGFPNRAAYAASKGGLVQVVKVLALEWAASGVNVNAVSPTATRTAMNEALFGDDAWRAEVLPRIPKGRFTTPDDIVGAVVFLAGPAAEMVTGQNLLVDGGWTAI
jgi:NAD(P)-dependent dehydrogenase (short-subunit alcohol dehydrogenase family)